MLIPCTLIRASERYLLPCIVLIVLVVYSPVAWHDFINYDDNVYVYENPNLVSGLTIDVIIRSFTTVYEVNWIPLTWISHALDVQLFGMNPAGHHVVNLLLHAANSVALYIILKRMTKASWRSALVALLFALHPLHVESVAWVAERKDVLSAFFGLLTFYMYCRYVETLRPRWYFFTLLFFVFGLLSKPMLVTLPLVLLLLDYWPLGRFISRQPIDKQLVRCELGRLLAEKIPFLILSIASSLITYLVQKSQGELVQGYSLISRAEKAGIAYVTYLHKMIWPAKLAVLYPFSLYPPSNYNIIFSLALILAISASVLLLRKRSPFLVVGWAWYIITLLPVIGLIQIGHHSVADRYTYIPLIGIFIILAWGGTQLFEAYGLRMDLLCGMWGIIIIIMILLTSLQLRHWKDGFSIFSHTVAVTKNNWVALHNLGLIYYERGDVDTAVTLYKESIKSKPSYSLPYVGLGVAYMSKNEVDAAIDAFTWALKFDPISPPAHYSLGSIYITRGDRQRAMEELQALQQTDSPYTQMLFDKLNSLNNKQLN